jgi:hypothetical protein
MRSVAALALYFAGLTILVSDKVVSQTLPQPTFVDYMPQVANLDKAEYFYHQLLGLESPQGDPRARLAWYPTRPFLVDMYVVSGKIRNFYLRVPVSDLMIEPIQWSEAKGKPLNPRIQDTGSTRLILNVNNIDALTDRLKRGKAKVITTGGKPVTVTDKTGTRRTIVFEDFNGFFVQLVELDPQPPQTGDAPPTYFINGSNLALTVADLDKSARFIGTILGLQVKTDRSRLEYLFLAVGRYLLSRKQISRATVDSVQSQNILAAQICDGTFNGGRAGRALANLAAKFFSKRRVFGFGHQCQCLHDALVRNETQERRLLQLRRKPLSQRAIENGIACGVGELRQNNRVLISEF